MNERMNCYLLGFNCSGQHSAFKLCHRYVSSWCFSTLCLYFLKSSGTRKKWFFAESLLNKSKQEHQLFSTWLKCSSPLHIHSVMTPHTAFTYFQILIGLPSPAPPYDSVEKTAAPQREKKNSGRPTATWKWLNHKKQEDLHVPRRGVPPRFHTGERGPGTSSTPLPGLVLQKFARLYSFFINSNQRQPLQPSPISQRSRRSTLALKNQRRALFYTLVSGRRFPCFP